jgi:HK97 family phage major capsid protein
VQHDAAMAEADVLEARAKKLADHEERARAEDVDPRRPVGEDRSAPAGGRETATPDAKLVFKRAMQFGAAALSAEERGLLLSANLSPELRALAAGAGATGGYTVPAGLPGRNRDFA